jgi:thiamine-phosphate pyrophosphorylase
MIPTSQPGLSLLAISDRSSLPDGDLTGWLAAVGQAGVPAVQLREKDLDDRALFELAVEAKRRLPSDTLLLINGRCDMAMAAGASGVHLPSDAVPVAALRRRYGDRLVIGCSTHHRDEVIAARDAGADYVTFGPVFDTPSKATYGPPPGLAGLRAVTGLGIPVLALGGMTCERFAEVAEAGARGAAAIRLLQPVSSAPAASAALREVVAHARALFDPRAEDGSQRRAVGRHSPRRDEPTRSRPPANDAT